MINLIDEYGIFPENINIPYIAVEIDPSLAKVIKKVSLYECDGKKIFDVKDKDGKLKQEKMIFILLDQ